jgi:uncharacterized membrane protein YGL010W
MRSIDRYFAEYDAYHRDARNEAAHAVGVPMILLAVVMLAAAVPLMRSGPVAVDLAWVLIAALAVLYVALSPALGLVATGALVALYLLGVGPLARNPFVALALFVVGWVIQFVGHHFEGRRPAFLSNAAHLLVGPLWILDRGLVRLGVRSARSAG